MSDKEGIVTQSDNVTINDTISSVSCEALSEDKDVSNDLNLKKPYTYVASNCAGVQLPLIELTSPPLSNTITSNAVSNIDFIASPPSDESDLIVVNDEEISNVDRQIVRNIVPLKARDDAVARIAVQIPNDVQVETCDPEVDLVDYDLGSDVDEELDFARDNESDDHLPLEFRDLWNVTINDNDYPVFDRIRTNAALNLRNTKVLVIGMGYNRNITTKWAEGIIDTLSDSVARDYIRCLMMEMIDETAIVHTVTLCEDNFRNGSNNSCTELNHNVNSRDFVTKMINMGWQFDDIYIDYFRMPVSYARSMLLPQFFNNIVKIATSTLLRRR